MAITEKNCLRCGHRWIPIREDEPKVCPRCKSYKWKVPKKVGGK